MPGWWVLGSIIAAIAGLAACINDLVLATIFASLGLLYPVWLIAANLWWVMGLIGLWLLIRRFAGLGLSLGVMLGLLGLAGAGFYGLRASQLAGLPPAVSEVLAQASGKARSLDYVNARGDAFRPYETCDAFCLAALGGGDLQWLRLERYQSQGMRQVVFPVAGKTCADLGLPEIAPKGCLSAPTFSRFSVIIERRDRADCLTDQPDFPADEICLRFVRDDGRKADLWLEISDSDAPLLSEAQRGLVRLTELRQLRLQDLRGAASVDLARHSARTYTLTSAPLPLVPNVSMNSNGGGLAMPHATVVEPLVDPAVVLQAAGVAVAAVQPEVMGAVYPGRVMPLTAVNRALVASRGADSALIWLRVGPPKPARVLEPKPRSAAEIAASKQARRAAENKMIMDAIRQGTQATAP